LFDCRLFAARWPGHASLAAEVYDPVTNPEDFATKIHNPFFNMPVGKKMIYEARMTQCAPTARTAGGEGFTRTVVGLDHCSTLKSGDSDD
jgi:hypothetical protein